MVSSLQGAKVLKHNPPVELPADRSKYRHNETGKKTAHVTAQHPQTLCNAWARTTSRSAGFLGSSPWHKYIGNQPVAERKSARIRQETTYARRLDAWRQK